MTYHIQVYVDGKINPPAISYSTSNYDDFVESLSAVRNFFKGTNAEVVHFGDGSLEEKLQPCFKDISEND